MKAAALRHCGIAALALAYKANILYIYAAKELLKVVFPRCTNLAEGNRVSSTFLYVGVCYSVCLIGKYLYVCTL